MITDMYVITFKVHLLYIKKYKKSHGIFQFSIELYIPPIHESLIILSPSFISPNSFLEFMW